MDNTKNNLEVPEEPTPSEIANACQGILDPETCEAIAEETTTEEALGLTFTALENACETAKAETLELAKKLKIKMSPNIHFIYNTKNDVINGMKLFDISTKTTEQQELANLIKLIRKIEDPEKFLINKGILEPCT